MAAVRTPEGLSFRVHFFETAAKFPCRLNEIETGMDFAPNDPGIV